MKYYPYGPIEIPIINRRFDRHNKEAINAFWDKFDEESNGLSSAVGCYIFSIRASKGIRPWYVGLAEKQSFRKECFAVHKLLNYNECLSSRKGTPVLTLIPKHTKTDRFAKEGKNGHKDIQFLEALLISSCLRRNPELLNIKSTKLLKEMVVPGLLNSPKGRIETTIKEFKKLIGT